MNKIVNQAIDAIFRTRVADKNLYELKYSITPYARVHLFTLGPPIEKYGAGEKKAVIAYAEKLLIDRFQSPENFFDAAWLLRFIDEKGEFKNEGEKIRFISKRSVDVDRALEDYRQGFKTKEHWLESVLDAHSFSLRVTGNIFYWRRG